MEIDQFKKEFPGTLVPIQGGVAHAFVPADLPPEVALTEDLFLVHGRAERALGRLQESLPKEEGINPFMMVLPMLMREAYYTSQLENTYTTPQKLVALDTGAPKASHREPDEQTREAQNYVVAAQVALERVREGMPICNRVICEAHATLLKGVRGHNREPGKYRSRQNQIGYRPTDPISEARYVPPPPEVVEALMGRLEGYINLPESKARYPTLFRQAFIHYQFEAIHPFLDGNGRIGRLLVPLILCANGVTQQPIVHISPILAREEKDREYRDRLLAVSTRGEWTEWLVFFLSVFAEAAEGTLDKTQELRALRHKYHQRARAQNATSNVLALIDEVISSGHITIGQAARKRGITPQAAGKNVRRLVELGLLEEDMSSRKNISFYAHEVLACLFR